WQPTMQVSKPFAELKKYFLIVTLGLSVVQYQVSADDRDQVLYVLPRTERQAEVLKNITSQPEVVLWKPDDVEHITANKEVHFYVNLSSVESIKSQLNKSAVAYSVLVNNAENLIEQQTYNETSNQRSPKSFYEQYHPLEDVRII
ncbi:hypothetical protein GDO86_004211, partial [Hymenochirus boettgeri]